MKGAGKLPSFFTAVSERWQNRGGGGGVRGGIAYSLIALLKVALFLGNNSQKVIAP